MQGQLRTRLVGKIRDIGVLCTSGFFDGTHVGTLQRKATTCCASPYLHLSVELMKMTFKRFRRLGRIGERHGLQPLADALAHGQGVDVDLGSCVLSLLS